LRFSCRGVSTAAPHVRTIAESAAICRWPFVPRRAFPRNFLLLLLVLRSRITVELRLAGGNTMICPNCHKEIADGSKFCYSCGAQLAPGVPAAAHVAPPKRLTRSIRDKKIAGVCAGVAEYFDIDPTLVRVLWLVALIFGGTGGLLYIILWIVLPVAPATATMTVPGSPAQV
jgi:phage shock protein C